MNAAGMAKRTDFRLVAMLALLATPLAGATQVQPAVQPGGDIPASSSVVPLVFQPVAPAFATSAYERRGVLIPMRDGAKLYAVLIIPKTPKGDDAKLPIMLERTPYSADKRTGLGASRTQPDTMLSPLDAELVRAGYILAIEDVRGKFGSGGDYVMNRPLRGPLNATAVDHSTDAWDTIDWLVRNLPQSNRRVSTIGTSY